MGRKASGKWTQGCVEDNMYHYFPLKTVKIMFLVKIYKSQHNVITVLFGTLPNIKNKNANVKKINKYNVGIPLELTFSDGSGDFNLVQMKDLIVLHRTPFLTMA